MPKFDIVRSGRFFRSYVTRTIPGELEGISALTFSFWPFAFFICALNLCNSSRWQLVFSVGAVGGLPGPKVCFVS